MTSNKRLNLAFCLFKYFPFGGLQVNFMNIAKECMARGHKVTAFTMSWEGDRPKGLEILLVSVPGISNHARYHAFANWVQEHVRQENFDGVVGFNRMPGLDVYYGADGSYAAKMMKRNRVYRYTPRYRTLMAMERSVYHKDAATQILLLTEKEKSFYTEYYGTGPERFHLMPPGISKDCLPPPNADEIGRLKRETLGIGQDKIVMLMVCSNFKIKGVARAIRAMAVLPPEVMKNTVLLVAGKDKPWYYICLARRMKVMDRVLFIGARDDVPDLLRTADFLIHPASVENTGSVIVEALAANVPVLTTDDCGYAFHVIQADGGIVVDSPFNQEELNRALVCMLTSGQADQWRANCKTYIEHTDIFSRAQKAADVIEKVV
ncbi:MAG: glucosyltransferase I RfaG [Desulfobacterales bacterium]|nr:MAG: glucosyltransferase I RfaG [Desulfobacterales bacterium]